MSLAPVGGLLAAPDFHHPQRVTTIAFGSDAEQFKPQEVWAAVNQVAPDVFIFAGDNVFGDTQDMMELRAAYSQLGMKEGYRTLQAQSEVLAIWDDHDLGQNDAYGDYPYKVQSEAEFLKFFDADRNSPRAMRPGFTRVTCSGRSGHAYRSFSWIHATSDRVWNRFPPMTGIRMAGM